MPKNNVLITPTLLDKFEFVKNAPPSWQTRAYEGFLQMIRREPGDFPAWIRKGIDFEDEVYKQCRKALHQKKDEITVGSANFQKVANMCLGGKFQTVLKKDIVVDGIDVLLYGKTDVVKGEKIIDIKTTLAWKGDAKYLKGWQHKLYLYMSGLSHFEYVVAVWESEVSDNIQYIKTVAYDPFTFGVEPDFEYDISEAVAELFSYLKDKNLYDDYYTIFSNNRR